MHFFRSLFLLPAALFSFVYAYTQNDSLVTTSGYTNGVLLSSGISYAITDKNDDGSKNISQIAFTVSLDSFNKELTRHFTTHQFWLRFSLKNTTAFVQRPYLNFGDFDYIDLIAESPAGTHFSRGGTLVAAGDFQDTAMQYHNSLPAAIPPGSEVVFYIQLRQQTEGFPFERLEIYEPSSLYQLVAAGYYKNRSNQILQIIFQGFMICQIIFIFLQWLFARTRDYFYYLMYLLLISLYFFSHFEAMTGESVFFVHHPVAAIYLHEILLTLPYFFNFRFSRFFLEMPVYFPRMNRALRRMEYAVLVVVLLNTLQVVIFFNIWMYAFIGAVSSAIFFFTSFVFIVYLLTQKQKKYGYYVICGGLAVGLGGITGIVLSFLQEYNYLHTGIKNLLIFGQTGFLIEVILFTLALSQKKIVDARHLAALELKALKAQMNPHFIFNSLSSIQESIVSNKTEAASKYLGKFSKLIRSVLENSDKKLITLQQEIDYLTLYLELESFRFDDFSFSVKTTGMEDLSFIKIPAMLVQPYVENAIKHGLSHKEGGKHLAVIFNEHSRHLLQVIIHDNGIGRKRSREINQSRLSSHQSMGMKITEERLRLQHANTQPVVIEDMKNERGEAAGTCVTIYLHIEE